MSNFRAEVIVLPTKGALWPIVVVAAALLILGLALGSPLLAGASDGCPHPGAAAGGAWFSGGGDGEPDYTAAIAAGATEYCYKAGPETPTPTPEIPTPTPTDTPPTPTETPPTPTPTDTPPCEECENPTPTPTFSPTPPKECKLIPQYEQWRLVDSDQKEGYVAACYIISVDPPSVERQATLCTACGDQLDQSESAYTFRADSWEHGTVYLNECTGEYIFLTDGGRRIDEWKSEWFRSGHNDNIRTSPRCPSCEAQATAIAETEE